MSDLKKVEIKTNSIFSIIEKYRHSADWESHAFSEFSCSSPIPCSDSEVIDFMLLLRKREAFVFLIISNVDIIKPGNCEGDNRYPVQLSATLLPPAVTQRPRYFIEVTGYNINEEYIYSL